MNHLPFRSKLYLLVMVLALGTSGFLVASRDTRANLFSKSDRLDYLSEIKAEVSPADARSFQFAKSDRLDYLSEIKANVTLADVRAFLFAKSDRLDYLSDIKASN